MTSKFWQTALCVGVLVTSSSAWADEPKAAPELADLREVLRGYETQAGEIRRKYLADLQTVQRQTVDHLQKLQDQYTRDAKLDEALAVRGMLRSLQANWSATATKGAVLPLDVDLLTAWPNVKPDPGTLSSVEAKIGDRFYFIVTGTTEGSAWGTDSYTADTRLAKAAVHASALHVGQRGVVCVTIVDGQHEHPGSTRNDVTTSGWSSYRFSYQVEPSWLPLP